MEESNFAWYDDSDDGRKYGALLQVEFTRKRIAEFLDDGESGCITFC